VRRQVTSERLSSSPASPGSFLGTERRAEYAAVYAAHATPGGLLTPNEEIAAITWSDGAEPLAGRAQPMDLWLGRRARPALTWGVPSQEGIGPERVEPPSTDDVVSSNRRGFDQRGRSAPG
jgi:hypothetical protein